MHIKDFKSKFNEVLDAKNIYLLPSILFSAFVIMLVGFRMYDSIANTFFWSNSASSVIDVFALIKSRAIIFISVMALFFMIYRFIIGEMVIKKTIYYYPLAIYAVTIILSYIFSEYKQIALWGYDGRFEGTIVLLCYLFMLFYTYNMINKEIHLKIIIVAVSISATILGLLGIGQLLGFDFMSSPFIQKLFTPSNLSIDTLTITTTKTVYMTLYNPNNVGLYSAFIVPIFGFLFITETKKGLKFVLALIYIILLYGLFGCFSSGGIIGVCVAFIVTLIVLNKKLLIMYKSMIVFVLITGIVFATMLTDPRLSTDLKSGISDLTSNDTKSSLEYIDTLGDGVIFADANNKVKFSLNSDQLTAYDEIANKQLTLINNYDKGYYIDDKQFEGMNIFLSSLAFVSDIDYIDTSDNGVTFSIKGEVVRFVLEGEEKNQFSAYDEKTGVKLMVLTKEDGTGYYISDSRFSSMFITFTQESDNTRLINVKYKDFVYKFAIQETGYVYYNDLGGEKFIKFEKILAQGLNEYIASTTGMSTPKNQFIVNYEDFSWTFDVLDGNYIYHNQINKTVELEKIDAIGFKNNQKFGTNRGWIWSRSIPLMKNKILYGYGADTTAVVFPQNDYVGKLKVGSPINGIVDKPHNMYLNIGISTGVLSLVSMIIFYAIYLLNSLFIYTKKNDIKNFTSRAGIAIFLGTCGFLIAALMYDNVVHVMPLFYTLLAMGLAINTKVNLSEKE